MSDEPASPTPDVPHLLDSFERQVRQASDPPGPGWEVDRRPRVMRATAPASAEYGGFIGWTDLSGLSAGEVDAFIATETRRWTDHEGPAGTGLGRKVEWKVYGHDVPADLGERLAAAGWEPEDLESLVLGTVRDVLAAVKPAAPEGVTFREVDPERLDEDLRRIGDANTDVWGGDFTGLLRELAETYAADPTALRIHLAEVEGEDGPLVVSAAWLRLHHGTEIASLWGGATRTPWRGRGIYRELVRRRAEQALDAGFRLLQVDASPDSRPILERLGMRAVTWTRPYVLHPAGTGGE